MRADLHAVRWYQYFTIAWTAIVIGVSWRHVALAEEITFARPDPSQTITVSADAIIYWQVGHYEILHLRGAARIKQGRITAAANEAILWVEKPTAGESEIHKVIAYLEDQVVVELPRAGEPHLVTGAATDRIVDEKWMGRFFTLETVDLDRSIEPLGSRPVPEIFHRAQQELENGLTAVQPVGFTTPAQQLVISPTTGAIQQIPPPNQPPQFGNDIPNNAASLPVPGQGESIELNRDLNSQTVRFPGSNPQINGSSLASPLASANQTNPASSSAMNVRITERDAGSQLNLKSFTNPQNENERVSIGVGGFRIAVDSPQLSQSEPFRQDQDRQVILLADNLVQWQSTRPDGSKSSQFYLEGNVVFAKDRRVIYAQKMFYDVELQRGTILDAEVLTPVPQYQGLVRLKADVVQQVDENNIQAFGTAFTSSRLGVPRYWLQSESVALTRQSTAATDPNTNTSLFDPTTGGPVTEDEYFVESQANRVYLGGVPVFAWPRFKTSLNEPSIYLKRFGVNNDQNFGFQVRTGWDLYQLLGWKQPPAGTNWTGLLDYLSERGIGYGTEFNYRRDELFGIPGLVQGQYKSWFINDTGRDFLGADRLGLTPEAERRGRLWGQHRHQFAPGFQLKAELGYISDRNFLEQYFEREWDTQKDATTGLWLERNLGTQSYNLTTDVQINDFYTQTTWLPKFDHFLLGQPLFNDRAVWHGHSHAGYAKMRVAEAPLNASEVAKFDPLAWEADVNGFRAGSRQELDFPLQFGPTKVVPYVLGDTTYWQEDLSGADLMRAYGQVGVRASLPFWKVDPTIQSVLWNVNGLAHKVSFDMDAFYADASQDLDELPLYDPLDDDAQEHFRRRFAFDTFGILPGMNVPLPYDERYFALRSGLQSHVTSPSMEIADDLSLVKLGVRQRWQTKRGLAGEERVIDWITLDAQTTLFPAAVRDNNGADFGLFDYDFAWHVGDRLSLVSDGYLDFFSQGLRTASFGANVGRPEIGNVYLGYRMIEGPISSNILSAFLTYRMSDKWGVNAGGQIDFGSTGSIGQMLNLVYIGESFLWQFGANYDVSRDNLGFRFGFEPRFTTKPRMFRPGGTPIPPAGSRWLE